MSPRYINACFLIMMIFILLACSPASTPAGIAPTSPAPTAMERVREMATVPPSLTTAGPETAAPLPELQPSQTPTSMEQAAVDTSYPPEHPLSAVQGFYHWYWDQPAGQVLTNHTYYDSPYLSDTFKADLPEILAQDGVRSGYDPFTCAQIDLPSLTYGPLYWKDTSAITQAQVVIDGEVRHTFVLQLSSSEGNWKIEQVVCLWSPQAPVLGFYSAYLGWLYEGGDALGADLSNERPMPNFKRLAGIYLTGAFADQALAQVNAGSGQPGAVDDPFFPGTGIPTEISLQPGEQESAVRLRLTIDARTTRYLNIGLEQVNNRWRIASIIPEIPKPFTLPPGKPNISAWDQYSAEAYDIQLRYPAGWSVERLADGSLPKDDPLKHSVFFYASGLSRNFPVLWLAVLEGSEDQVIHYYVTEDHQEVQINGQVVWVDRELGNTRFIFTHPTRPNTWLVLGDSGSNEDYKNALQGALSAILQSVSFQK